MSAAPSSVLLVLHVENMSGPLSSVSARLEPLREAGTRVTTLIPREGAAASLASELGDVAFGIPGALLMPRGPRALAATRRAVQDQEEVTRRTAERVSADLVIVTSARLPGAIDGAKAAGAGVVLHEGELPGGSVAGRVANRLLARRAHERVGAVVVPSRAVAMRFSGAGAPVHVVNPSIRPAAGPGDGAGFRQRHRIREDEALVGALGALTRGRGQDVALRALAAQPDAEWRLVIAGASYPRDQDVRFAHGLPGLARELGVAERVTFVGALDDPADLFAACDVFLNPARAPESFGRASCEALLAGCPVVSTRVGGVTEALQHGRTAILVPPDDAEAIAEAVGDLVSDPVMAARIATAGAADVAERFSPPAGEKQWLAAIAGALASRPGAAA